jgi:uncharacterized protein YndB with AHSA1/START domain
MARVLVEHDFSKPVDRVFAYLSEHENLQQVFGAKVTRAKDGDDGHRNGVGSVRTLRIGPGPSFDETVTEFVADELIRYRITRGSPLRDHRGEMRFSRSDGGSHLRYEITFTTRLPGLATLIAAVLSRNIGAGLRRVDANA